MNGINPLDQPLHSEEINDIISQPPKWIIRWGITVCFAVLLLVLVFSAYFRYPVLLRLPAKLVMEFPPLEIKSTVTGKVAKILVKNGMRVVPGQTLAFLESDINPSHALYVLSKCKKLQLELGPGKTGKGFFNQKLNLGQGPVESKWREVIVAYAAYHSGKLGYKDYYNTLTGLIMDLEQWKKHYVVTAVATGNICFAGLVADKSYVSSGQNLFFITRPHNKIYAIINFPESRLGELNRGQKAYIKLSQKILKYGKIEGTISQVAKYPVIDSTYNAKVVFNNDVFSETALIRNNMKGVAEIHLTKTSVLQRLLEQKFKAFSR